MDSCGIAAVEQLKNALALLSKEVDLRSIGVERLYRLSESMISSFPLDVQRLSQAVVEIIQGEFGKSSCSVFLVQKDSNTIKRISVVGPCDDKTVKKEFAIAEPGLIPQAVCDGHITNIGDIGSDPKDVSRETHFELIVPLTIGDRVIGAIDVQSAESNAFPADEERLMAIFAERVGLLLKRDHMHEETNRHLQHMASLYEIHEAITSCLDISLIMNMVLEKVRTNLNIDAADILIFDPATNSFRCACSHGFQTKAKTNAGLKFEAVFPGKMRMERRIYIIQDLPKMGNGIPRSAEFIQEGFKTYLGVPMMVKGSLKGVLEIFQRDEFTPAEGCLCFLKIVAGEVAIALDNSQMLKSLQRSACELDIAYDATIEGWLQALNYREIETKEHIRRVAEMAVCLAERMGVNESQIIHIWRGAMLHDIGKMGIAESILLKPGPLSYQEREIIHGYPKIAYDLLAPIKYLQPALDIPYCFHEKWDGTGYPRGLKGNQIPQAARLFAIIHMWDVLLFDRPYRRAWPEKKVRQYLREQEGTHFDPNIVELFFQFLDVQRLR